MKMKIGYARFPHLPLFPSFIISRKNNAMLYVNLLYTVMHCVQIASDNDKWTDTKPHRYSVLLANTNAFNCTFAITKN